MIDDKILMDALTITIDKIKEDDKNADNSDLIIMSTLILSIYIKQVNILLAKEENKDDNSREN